ncbi:hypothetical protein FQN54_000781 [Arachnomyces sp. PD_36]|nr:hypothetical protein FQN54_000781 [Arachnomyces sp. PD_36]
MKFFTAFSLLSLPLIHASSAGTSLPLEVETSSGTVEGFNPHKSLRAFLGIPYARPPVGDLRFKPPQALPPSNSSSLIDATKFGNSCVQFRYKVLAADKLGPSTGESEDCLTLNVWGPAKKNEELLPVLVWVYGGGFGEGGSSDPMYDPTELVKKHQDVMFVSFNYRVNIFGFPDTPALGKDEKNLGLRDQRLALEWLRDNIESFGGDPERMTLFGQSAGAISAAIHSFWNADDPIVQAMILQSGQPESSDVNRPAEFSRVAENAGCADEDKEAELECMRTVDSLDLRTSISPLIFNYFGYNAGGTLTQENVTYLGRESYVPLGMKGKFAQIPYLIGQTNDEGDGVVPFTPEGGINKTFAESITLAAFTCTSSISAAYRSALVPVWRYRYMAEFASACPFDFVGSAHGSEIPFIFGTYDNVKYKDLTQDEVDASEYIQNAWVTFAKDPYSGLSDEIGWPRYNPQNDTLVEIFPDNKVEVKFVSPNKYDEPCKDYPSVDPSGYVPYC